MEKTFTIVVHENGYAYANEDGNENIAFQNFGNAFEMCKVSAEKFIAERTVEKGIIAKKEMDDAQGDSGLAGEDKEETPESV